MKTKRILAAVLSLCLLGGAFAYDAPVLSDFSITADAAGECYTFNSTTGLLTLKGNVILDEISGFEKKAEVKNIKAAAGTVLPESCRYLFSEYQNCISIDLKNADTSNVTDMYEMFSYCHSLTSLDLTSFDTSKVTEMFSMFRRCKALTSIDLSHFNTSKVTDMRLMFSSCYSLTSLDLSSFDTSNVQWAYYMFSECRALTSIKLSSLDTSNVTNMDRMFYECAALTLLDLSSFDTSSVESANGMFDKCINLSVLILGENFGDIAEGHRLINELGWINSSDTSTVVSGSGEYAAFPNGGKNTYVRDIPMQGDVNCDGFFKVSDLVTMQKWLLAAPESGIGYWKAGDVCNDGKLNVYDLCDMREKLVESKKATYSVVLKAAGKNKDEIVDIIYNFAGGTTDFDKALIILAVNNAPVSITSSVNRKDAEQLVADLKAQGAILDVTQN